MPCSTMVPALLGSISSVIEINYQSSTPQGSRSRQILKAGSSGLKYRFKFQWSNGMANWRLASTNHVTFVLAAACKLFVFRFV